jgi:hypothetical protein
MTLKTISWLLIGLFSLVSIGSFAQKPFQQKKRPNFPAWVSEKGYWVVESNINTPLDHVVSFYDNDNTLIYKETLQGVKINPEKRKVKMKLKKILESAVLAFETKKANVIPGEETALVKSAFQ